MNQNHKLAKQHMEARQAVIAAVFNIWGFTVNTVKMLRHFYYYSSRQESWKEVSTHSAPI